MLHNLRQAITDTDVNSLKQTHERTGVKTVSIAQCN